MAESYEPSNVTAFEIAEGRDIVDFTTNAAESLKLPNITPLNFSASKQWKFNGVSKNGMSSIMFGFYHDPNYAVLGAGNFQNASAATIPYYHWSEPIPAADIHVNVEIKGKVTWAGMGGHERFCWFTCLTNLNAVRSMLGPYVLKYFGFDSILEKETSHHSVALFQDRPQILWSTLGSPSETEGFAIITKSYGGAVTSTLKDKVTGYQLELVSPSKIKHYAFFAKRANLGFEYILGKGVVGCGFSVISRGGHVGLSQY
ncbi:hypothetical protein O1611_g1304 [Lasiodiplodia mahajangana]|uniref:Uncharacterized protein n=1 Tax=Lasiodiplodia mahajangana TaxID=1108764 RepID=A0ACC2JXT3_9PEZI|nr:hypothetical protein O1611_g1304 [Lasiodiplodia mahajangana]